MWGCTHTIPLVLLLFRGGYLLPCLSILFSNILIKVLKLVVYHYLFFKKISHISATLTIGVSESKACKA